MLSDYFRLALKNVRKRGIRSWLTMLGVFIGIAAVVSLISLGQGLETAIVGQFGTLSVDTLTVQGADTGFAPPGSASVSKISEEELEIIQDVPGVRIAIARYLRPGEVEFNDRLGFGFIASLPHDQDQLEEIYSEASIELADGRLLDTEDSGEVVIGDDYANSRAYGRPIEVGDTITIRGSDFKVAGVLERSSTFTINGAILMMEEDLKDAFDIPQDDIDFVVVRVEDEDEIDAVAEEIRRDIRRERGQDPGEEDFEVQTPSQSLEAVQTILGVINIVVTGIAMIALFVGGIGIANTMFTSVIERTKQIGVMKAIGAQNKDILFIFLLEAGLLGLVGGIIGAIIGLGLAMSVSLVANAALGEAILTVSPNYGLLLGAIAFSLFVGILSGLIPALQASKLNPVEALRK